MGCRCCIFWVHRNCDWAGGGAKTKQSSQPSLLLLTDSLMLSKASHSKYFRKCINTLPQHYVVMESMLLTAVYFSVIALDILNDLGSIDKLVLIDYIYSLQLSNTIDNGTIMSTCGFLPSTYMISSLCQPCSFNKYCQGHLAMTYTALSALVTLGDDLSRVNKFEIIEGTDGVISCQDSQVMSSGMKALQQPDGSFRPKPDDSESDIRFLYCACAVSTLLQDWSGIDIEAAIQYILNCITYEGGIGLTPGGVEAQGGSCYCGLASLLMMGRAADLGQDRVRALEIWCVHRQVGGYQGRTNKDPDSCYSFWVGATLQMLRCFDCSDMPSTRYFLLNECQRLGGFSKYPDMPADVLHSFYSLCWLSMEQSSEGRTGALVDSDEHTSCELKSIDVRLGITAELGRAFPNRVV